ncbi:MAG TPA: ABC transporter permease [Gemmatimonadales bacterium]|nr:ABC transporter permease [Gemmatimonadales bacterium]
MPNPTSSSIGIGFATLRANPMRTALSTLGIIIGAASLVAVLSLGDGLEQFGRMQLGTTTDIQSIVVQPRTVQLIDGQAYLLDRIAIFTPATTDSLLARIPGAASATLTLSGVMPGDSSKGMTQVVLTLANAAEQVNDKLAAGRYFTAEEVSATAHVVVLSEQMGRSLTGVAAAEAVGRTVELNGHPQRIVGVLKSQAGELKGGIVYAPIGAQGELLAPTPRPRSPTLILQARRVEDVREVQQGVESWLASDYGAEWKKYATVQSNLARVKQVELGMKVFKGFMGAITGISLIVGGIGIMNVLLAAVAERTREIGVRKAIGARRKDVLAQFLAESVAISGIGSLVGALLGLSSAFAITSVIRQQTSALIFAGFSWGSMAVAAVSALFVGLTFGLYPALRASRLSPIDAIRHD